MKNKKILFGLLGEKLDHSLSPQIFNHYFEKHNLDIRYEPFPLLSDNLPLFFKEIRTSDMIGLNVTIPFKEKIISYLDYLSQDAKNIGAVNVISNDKGKLKGHNTDHTGFLRTLEKYSSLQIESAVILGAGGAARSIIYGLGLLKLKNIFFFARKTEKITKMLRQFRFIPNLAGNLWIKERIQAKIEKADIVVNTTPVGMSPLEKESPVKGNFTLKSQCIVYDLIYNPRVTPFLKTAQSKGAIIENGLGMLVYQAIESLKIWREEFSDEESFIKSCEEVLNASLSNRR